MVTARILVDEEVHLYPVPTPADLAAVRPPRLVSIALTCARDSGWDRAWSSAFLPADAVTMLVDTPFAQSLAALLDDPADFRWTIVAAGGLPVFVCAAGDYPPWLRPCTGSAAGAFRMHLARRGKAREVDGLAALSPHPAGLAETAARLVSEESLVETVG